ncbi:D-2-hydroxyacid dehydrogenase family protein [soil metagenome]
MKIAILDDYQDAVRHLECFSMLAGHDVKIFTNSVKGAGQLGVRLRDAEALVLIRERTRLTRAVLDKLPNLKVIAQTGRVSRDPDGHIDLQACADRGIAVLEGSGSPVAPAELTWALIMAAQRRIPQYVMRLIHGAWQQSGLKGANMPPNHGIGRVLRGTTLGVWSYGKIGSLVAGYGRAFGMKVIVWGREKSVEAARTDGYEVAASREQFFADADVLSVHLRLNEATRGIVKYEDLARMKPTSLFVNTSRAELVEADALVRALNNGRPGFAALDVFDQEPILQGHTLLRLENTICTPHIGYVELDTYEMYFSDAFRQLCAFAETA